MDEIADVVLGGPTWRVGVAALAIAVTIGRGRGRQLAKGVIKGCLAANDRMHGWTGRASESLEDLYASDVKPEAVPDRDVDAPAAEKPAARPRRRRTKVTESDESEA